MRRQRNERIIHSCSTCKKRGYEKKRENDLRARNMHDTLRERADPMWAALPKEDCGNVAQRELKTLSGR